MRKKLIEGVEASHLRKNTLKFLIGDTVSVKVKIKEGAKERIQPFIGVVIARRGAGMNETFTVRRIVNDEGVERIFPIHSPAIQDVEVMRSGESRRAKLYYLRDRVGKARRLREKRAGRDEGESAPAASGETAGGTGRTPAKNASGAALAGV